jgi:hypothetical protein
MPNYLIIPRKKREDYIENQLKSNRAILLSKENYEVIEKEILQYKGYGFLVKDEDIWYRDYSKQTMKFVKTVFNLMSRWKVYDIEITVISSGIYDNLMEALKVVSKPIRNILDGVLKEV